MKPSIKIITGFRKDQFFTIDAEEAHNAYYLFLNPQERGVFKNGVALKGEHIQGIDADYNSMMGWNPDHSLDSDDWNEIRSLGIDVKMRDILLSAKNIARKNDFNLLSKPLSEVIKDQKYLDGETDEDETN